jgi:hypothetical protein
MAKTSEELQRTIAEIFGVESHDVSIDFYEDPRRAGRVYFGENRDVMLTYGNLVRLADLLGHRGINIDIEAATPDYSELTPGDPGNVWLRFDRSLDKGGE